MRKQIRICTALLILATCSAINTAQSAFPGSVAIWGDLGLSVPLAAENNVVAVAAGLVLKEDGSVVRWGSGGDLRTGTVVYPAGSGVTAFATGDGHLLVLKNGGVVASGYNFEGQTDVPFAAKSGVIAIAAGEKHSVALKSDGTVVTWGDDFAGQVTGTPTTDFAMATPVTLGGQVLTSVVAIAAGGAHTVALKNDGTVVAWGANNFGQVTGGAPSFSEVANPVTRGGQVLTGVTAIAAGDDTMVLRNDGSVIVWGYNFSGETNVPVAAQSGVTAIASGYSHFLALKSDGTVVAWGGSDPVTETGLIKWGNQVLQGVTAIGAALYDFSGAIVAPVPPAIIAPPASQTANIWQSPSFTVTATGFPLHYQWRKDGFDLPGANSATLSLPLVQANQAGNYTVVVSNFFGVVTSAPLATLTVNSNLVGTVVVWKGDEPNQTSSDFGQTNVPVAAQSGVTAIAAGYNHTLALKSDGSVVAWSYDEAGESTVPAAAGSGVIAISAGAFHSMALKNDGSVVAWGGATNSANWPNFGQSIVPVAAMNGVSAISAGGLHSMVLKTNGAVIAWGWNDLGQTNVPVLTQSGVLAIAAGFEHSAALRSDGSVVVWGRIDNGETNVPVAAQSGVIAIAAGAGHTLGLKNNGSVVAWGANYFGQATVPAAAQSGVIAIAAGDDHSVALKQDGTVVVWGGNGQTNVPAGLNGVMAISTGNHHTVALLGTAPPSLNARPSGNQLILSWPANAVGFALQSAPSLSPPVIWNNVSNAPALAGGKWTVTNSSSGGYKFFRLSKP